MKMEAIRRSSRPLHGTDTQKETVTDYQPSRIPKIYIGKFGNKGSHVSSIRGRISDEGCHNKSNHKKVVLLVNLVEEFTVATSVTTLLIIIRKYSCKMCASFDRFDLKLNFVVKFY